MSVKTPEKTVSSIIDDDDDDTDDHVVKKQKTANNENNKQTQDPVWNWVKKEIDNKTGKILVFCKLCKKMFQTVKKAKPERVRPHFDSMNSNCCEILKQNDNNNSLNKYTVPKLSTDSIEAFHREFAIFFYTSGIAFNVVENDHLLIALQKLRPDVKLPSRKSLSEQHLNFHFELIQKKLENDLNNNNGYISLTSDTTTNQRGIPITNFMCVTNGKAYYYGSKVGGAVSHTGDLIAAEIIDVMNKLGNEKVVGLCTDNASNNV